MLRDLKFNDIKTEADATRYYTQECLKTGIQASLISYVAGVVTFPFAFRKWGTNIPFMREYKILLGASSMMFVSYFIGKYARSKCEDRVKKELYDLTVEK